MEHEMKNMPLLPFIIWVESTGGGEIHYCPQCGAILDQQDGFAPDAHTWICKECHQVLYGDIYEGDAFPGVLWFCDGCGDLLNQQKGFRDTLKEWACKKCGHIEHFDMILDFQPLVIEEPE